MRGRRGDRLLLQIGIWSQAIDLPVFATSRLRQGYLTLSPGVRTPQQCTQWSWVGHRWSSHIGINLVMKWACAGNCHYLESFTYIKAGRQADGQQ